MLNQKIKSHFLKLILFFASFFLISLLTMNLYSFQSHPQSVQLLTEPFLQLPTENSVNVVWFTAFEGRQHFVKCGDNLEKITIANTTLLTWTREDQDSKINPSPSILRRRLIWRHEAKIMPLMQGIKVPYRVVSQNDTQDIKSDIYTLSATPQATTPLKILLTSDHQLMPMVAANLQKVSETIGTIDGVFYAGDLVNIPDRASEWFDDNRGGSFFPCFQGKASYELEKKGVKTRYKGGKILQNAPLFSAIGNHEVMGKFSHEKRLNQQFEHAYPRSMAQELYREKIQNSLNLKEALENYSFNTNTYQEIFSFPMSELGGKRYYAVTFGDVHLVVLYVTQIWRKPEQDNQIKGRYQEAQQDFNRPENWGYGQHIFESIARGSPQYQWLETELESSAYQQAKYKIIMLHHPPHTLGGNIVPPFTDPIQKISNDQEGKIQAITYNYPKEKDYIIRDLIPLLESSQVNLVFFGHSHLWNRFQSSKGMHFLETSNVGNSYGAHFKNNPRLVPPNNPNYIAIGDPNGLEPIIPSIAPLMDENNQPLPYIASNDITVFSILDTATGRVSSYRFDTRYPDSEVIKFDEFSLT